MCSILSRLMAITSNWCKHFAEHAEDLSPEDFLEIAEDGWKIFNCLTDEELAQFQENYAPSMVP